MAWTPRTRIGAIFFVGGVALTPYAAVSTLQVATYAFGTPPVFAGVLDRLLYAFSALAAGMLTDRFGAKRLSLVALAAGISACLGCAAAPSAIVLYYSNLLLHSATFAVVPPLLAWSLAQADAARWARVFGIGYLVFLASALIAPFISFLLSDLLEDPFAWRQTYGVLAGLVGLGFFIALAVPRGTKIARDTRVADVFSDPADKGLPVAPVERARVDWPALVFAVFGLAAVYVSQLLLQMVNFKVLRPWFLVVSLINLIVAIGLAWAADRLGPRRLGLFGSGALAVLASILALQLDTAASIDRGLLLTPVRALALIAVFGLAAAALRAGRSYPGSVTGLALAVLQSGLTVVFGVLQATGRLQMDVDAGPQVLLTAVLAAAALICAALCRKDGAPASQKSVAMPFTSQSP